MSVVQGNPVLASDYNTLKDEINKWFGDSNPSMTFGNGNQSYGWGGSNVSAVVAGNDMLASEMNALIDRCNVGEDICNSVSGQLSQIVAGNVVTAAEFNAIETKSDLIDTNRLDIEAAELSLTAGGNSVRSTNWGVPINCTFRYTFSNFAEARYFFNSGGALNIYGTITGYSTGTGWDGEGIDEMLTDMGTLLMNYTQTTRSGPIITSSIGYYDLTTGYQTLYSATGSGAYGYPSEVTILIEARYGSSGAYVEFRVTLTPESGRTVDGTTTITTQQRKLDNQSSGAVSLIITAPSYSLIDGL